MGGSAFLHQLYDGSYRRLVLQLFAVCGDMADAEDAVQEAFVRAIRQGRAFDEVSNPEAWLRTVALNHQRNSWRHAKVVRRFVTMAPGPQALVELGPDHVAVVTALAALDIDQRLVVVLRYLADRAPQRSPESWVYPRARSIAALAGSRTLGPVARRAGGERPCLNSVSCVTSTALSGPRSTTNSSAWPGRGGATRPSSRR